MSTAEMTLKIHELKELQALIEEAEVEAESIRDQIKSEMIASGAEEITVDVYKVRWTKVKSSRIDTIAFKKAMPDLARRFTKHTESRRFSIV